MELVKKKEFVVPALDSEDEIFLVYVASFTNSSSDVHSSRQSQIASLKADKAPIAIPNEYANFVQVFLPDLIAELLEYTMINDHVINLIDGK